MADAYDGVSTDDASVDALLSDTESDDSDFGPRAARLHSRPAPIGD